MAKRDLTEAQLALLRKLPDRGDEFGGVIPARFPPATRRKLQEAGLVEHLLGSRWVRTPAGRALIEAEDKRISAKASDAAEPIFCPACQKYHPVA